MQSYGPWFRWWFGGGHLGIAYVARANPDGHTLLFTSTAIAVNSGLFSHLPYDPIKDFAPISELVNAPNVLLVRAESGINTSADLVAKAKAEPNTLNHAWPGVGTRSHLTGELLKLRASLDIQQWSRRCGSPRNGRTRSRRPRNSATKLSQAPPNRRPRACAPRLRGVQGLAARAGM